MSIVPARATYPCPAWGSPSTTRIAACVALAFLGGSPRLSGPEEGHCSDDVDGRFAEMRVQGSFQASEIVGAVMEDTCLVKAFHGSSAEKVVAHIFAKDGGAEEDAS
jgi:hypothetical protein